MTQRKHIRVLAPVSVAEGSIGDSPKWVARDIGEGGFFVFTQKRWPVGSSVPLRIEHGQETIQASCKVLRHEESGVGFSFDGTGARVQDSVRKLLEHLFEDGQPADEQRRTHRRPVFGAVAWNDNGTERIGRIVDLSPEGARISSEQHPSEGTEIYMYVPVYSSDSDHVQWAAGCEGRVIRKTQEDFAVTFKQPSTVFREALAHVRNNPTVVN